MVDYYVIDSGVDVHIGTVNLGERIRWDAQHWVYFTDPKSMCTYIRSCGSVRSSSGQLLAAEEFLSIPAISVGTIHGGCCIIQGYVYELSTITPAEQA